MRIEGSHAKVGTNRTQTQNAGTKLRGRKFYHYILDIMLLNKPQRHARTSSSGGSKTFESKPQRQSVSMGIQNAPFPFSRRRLNP